MKILIITIAFLSVMGSMKAQNGDAPALPINWNDATAFIPTQDEFYLGYHWSYQRLPGNVLLHSNHFMDSWGFSDTRKFRLGNIPNDGKKKALVWNVLYNGTVNYFIPAIQYDPTAPVIPVMPWDKQGSETLPPRSGDTTAGIFGFAVRDTIFGSLPAFGTTNFDRYILTKTGVPDTGKIVLDNASLQSSLFYNMPDSNTALVRRGVGIHDTLTGGQRNGSQWYFSVNLRRTSTTDTIMDDSVVLVIKLPYVLQDSTLTNGKDSIRFDRVPETYYGIGNVDTLPFNRGVALKHRPTPGSADSTEFVITRRMLPKGNATNPDITISAFFRLKSNQDNTAPNPELQNLWKSKLIEIDPSHIIRMGATVRYYGHSTVGIDWLRFEAPYSQLFFRSYLDSSYVGHYVNIDIDTIRTYSSRGIRLLSFYGLDDPGGYLMTSLGERHMSRLLSGRWLNYFYGSGRQYDIIKPSNRWLPKPPSASIGAWGAPTAPPYKFNNLPIGSVISYATMNGGWGPQIYPYIGVLYDSLTGSTYEQVAYSNSGILRDTAAFLARFDSTYLPNGAHRAYSINHCDTNNYKWKGWYKYPEYLYIGGDAGPLPSYEAWWNFNYKIDSSLAFSGQPWWTNIWLGSSWTGGKDSASKPYLDLNYLRPQTGEETRLQIWGVLIHGCKGLMYERLHHEPSLPNASTLTANQVSPLALLGAMNTINDTNTITDAMLNSWGERMFDSTMIELGGDFIVPGDSTHMDQYLDSNDLKTYMAINPQRFYIGRLSTRHEVKRVADLIAGTNGIGSTLMDLRLKASWYKGYEVTSVGDTALMSSFIELDTTKLRTRPIGRTTYEDADSSFVNVTFLNNITDSSGHLGYIGVVNPRTSPFVWIADTDALAINRPDTIRHSSRTGKVLTFLTTMEYEKYVALGKLDKYSQTGAREITIPFNYHDTLGRYALIHVEELGGGIDTIINQNSHLAINFLPGEGKIFKVNILLAANIEGRLQYSNQRKMVGYPIRRADGTPSDSVYYHLTYHRYDSAAALSSVYYRRSNPVWYNSSSENVTWQSERLLSEYIRLSNCVGDSILRLNCAYPSLVVRYDNIDSMNKVYVVYSCNSPSMPDSCNPGGRNYIVENVLKAEVDASSYVADTARYFNTFQGIMSEYGNPMVNASARGNYYCWSDSVGGISIGWKSPNSRQLTDYTVISWGYANGGLTYGCKHPSMNSYSRIGLEEADCAVVWEEKINLPVTLYGTVQHSNIFYSRLRMVGDTSLENYLPPTFYSPGESVSMSFDGKIARMTTGINATGIHTLPSVYRDLVDSVVSGSTAEKQRDARTDCLTWVTAEHTIVNGTPKTLLFSRNVVYRRSASILDSSSVPKLWGVGGVCRIWSDSSSNIGNPSLSQGIAGIGIVDSHTVNTSDSAVVLSLNEYLPFSSTPAKNLWHIRGNVDYLYSAQNTTISDYSDNGFAKLVTNKGEYGQTSALPTVGFASTWRKIRRIYQTDGDSTEPSLQMSPQYFLKGSASESLAGFTGFSNEVSKYMLSSPMLDDRILSFNRVKYDSSNEQQLGFYDRISTDWFTVGDAESLWLKSLGTNDNMVQAFVERRSDGAEFAVQLGTSDDSTALWTEIELQNGGTEEYRFFVVKDTTQVEDTTISPPQYGEEMVLRGLNTTTSSAKVGAGGNQVIDLGREVNVGASIRVYPNPAREKVTIVVTDTNQKNTWHVKVMNVLGTILSENDSKPNTSIEIVTEDYPTGIYYITAESEKMSTRTRFVIMR